MSLHLQDTRIGSLLAVNLLVVVCCCDAVTIQKPAPFCLLIKSERGSSQVSFLIHSPDTTASPLFYWSKWTSEKRLEGCFMSSDGSLVTRYRSLCRQERTRDNEKPMHFNFSALLEDASLCEMNMHVNFTLHKERINPGQQMDSRAKSRHKRAWVLPGTLWCGRGTSANDYEQLGMFVHADRCCREHDHCEHIIRSFSVNFGVFNPTLFTLSHCDCDHRFKQCLLNGNDTISNMVGYSFFNVLKLRCFELIQRRQLQEMKSCVFNIYRIIDPSLIYKSVQFSSLFQSNLPVSVLTVYPVTILLDSLCKVICLYLFGHSLIIMVLNFTAAGRMRFSIIRAGSGILGTCLCLLVQGGGPNTIKRYVIFLVYYWISTTVKEPKPQKTL
uniref:Group 3 secretory phospholipase A2-like n=1 Tax=Sinocyclocheilus anshuiensis TaxID=1608454 RepID=A0A671QEX6_9TELE